MHAVHHDGSNGGSVPLHIDLFLAGATGGAVEIDAIVPQRRPDLIHVVHGQRLRVEADVSGLVREARADVCVREDLLEVRLQRRVRRRRRACQGIRAAGAADVNEHEVAMLMDVAEQSREVTRRSRRGGSRTPVEVEHRIRSTRAERRQDDQVDGDLPARPGGAVLPYQIAAAARVAAVVRCLTGDQLDARLRERVLLTANAAADGERCEEEEKTAKKHEPGAAHATPGLCGFRLLAVGFRLSAPIRRTTNHELRVTSYLDAVPVPAVVPARLGSWIALKRNLKVPCGW